jgi:hypothetical protein
MVILQTNLAIAQTVALLIYYCFDPQGTKVMELVAQWRQDYQDSWIRLAVLESLYRGRYKAVSVEQILSFWERRGEPIYYFGPEFERLISHNLPPHFINLAETLDVDNILGQEEELGEHSLDMATGIAQFTPLRDQSKFYLKLKAVAKQKVKR